MRGFVVDASVAVKWLVDEPLSDEAAKLLEEGLLLAAPELIYAEVANALDLLADAPLIVPSSMKQLMPAAARLAADLDHPVYDCMYLALGIQE